jgi:hypothetical protein
MMGTIIRSFAPLPDHSSLTRIRERFGLSVFRRFFERIVQECFAAGLVWGEELFLDSTKVEANVSLESAGSRMLLEGRLEGHQQARLPDALPVVVGGKARVVLDVLVAATEVNESLPMVELLCRNRFRWRLSPRSVTADAAYGTRENVAPIEETAIRAYVALPEQGGRTALFTIEDFVYDTQKDLYNCPSGETLHRLG